MSQSQGQGTNAVCTDSSELRCSSQTIACSKTEPRFIGGGTLTVATMDVPLGTNQVMAKPLGWFETIVCYDAVGLSNTMNFSRPSNITQESGAFKQASLPTCNKGYTQVVAWGVGAPTTAGIPSEGEEVANLEGVTGLEITCFGDTTPQLRGTKHDSDRNLLQKKTLLCTDTNSVFNEFQVKYFSEQENMMMGDNVQGMYDIGGSPLVCVKNDVGAIVQTAEGQWWWWVIIGIAVLLFILLLVWAFSGGRKETAYQTETLAPQGPPPQAYAPVAPYAPTYPGSPVAQSPVPLPTASYPAQSAHQL